MSEKKFEFHFHAPVGQNIANVEHMDVHLDKDGQIQVLNAEKVTAEHKDPESDPELKQEVELTDGTLDQHLQLFKDAMLQVQSAKYSEIKYAKAISNTYDWQAVVRLGQDIGLLGGYTDLIALMKDEQFKYVPANPQNLNPYRKYINDSPTFPHWQCSHPAYEGTFRKFKFIADNTYSLYCLACAKHHIKPYGPGRK